MNISFSSQTRVQVLLGRSYELVFKLKLRPGAHSPFSYVGSPGPGPPQGLHVPNAHLVGGRQVPENSLWRNVYVRPIRSRSDVFGSSADLSNARPGVEG